MAETAASAQHNKSSAAFSSLLAAFVLTSFKIVVGVLTGSLGILAEAAHSGLDLVAALVTFLAVRISGRPADASHTYGHGKVENLSALFETLLLLATCAWIVHAAIVRMLAGTAELEVNIWSFLVMGTSIAIDVSRSRLLSRVAKKYNSQALEADALHFETDVWSSAVVILGLVAVQVARKLPAVHWLIQADAVAALGVALIVIVVSFNMGFRAIQALVDAAPAGIAQQIAAAAEAVPGVMDCHDVRVRHSGPTLFADIHVTVDGGLPLRDAHALTERIEQAVRGAIPQVDLVVHPEPSEPSTAPLPPA